MSWTPEKWDLVVGVLRRGFPGDFMELDEQVYRAMIVDLSPKSVMAGLRGWTETFRPSVGDIRRIAEAYVDPALIERVERKRQQLETADIAETRRRDAELDTWARTQIEEKSTS